ncbi:MAG: HEAT repeat domain-containing protein [Phycisphaerae bacterium]|jgi:HEAT repeat protein|nr:HEAT repeat domain-containing protein [Phycisphaerae bacterium]
MKYVLFIFFSAAMICGGSEGVEAAAGDAEAKFRALRAALSYGDTKAKLGAIGETAKLGRNGEGAAGLLVSALSDTDRSVRLAAIGALGKIGASTTQVIAAITKIVDGKDAAAAAGAVNVLGQIGPNAATSVDTLLKYAEGKDSKARKSVIYALARIGPTANRAVPMIIRAFKSPDRNLRESAAYALGNIGQPIDAVVPALIAALSDSDSVVRERGALGLGMIGPKAAQAKTALRKALKDTDPTVASRAAWALGRLGATDEQTIAALIKLLHSTERHSLAAAALGRTGKPGIDALIKMLDRPDAPARLLAIRALGQIGLPASAASPAVRKAINDKDADVRRAATIALKKIFISPAQRVNVLAVNGKHSLVCRSSWHNANKSWPVKDTVAISGLEAVAMISPKLSKDRYEFPKELAISLGERLFKTAQFTDAQKKELAKWLGSGVRDEKSLSSGSISATSTTRLTGDGSTQMEVAIKGLIRIEKSHRLADRYGPNWNEAKWSINISGTVTIDRASGRIIKAKITADGQTKGHYGAAGSNAGELYTESFKLTLTPAPEPRRNDQSGIRSARKK